MRALHAHAHARVRVHAHVHVRTSSTPSAAPTSSCTCEASSWVAAVLPSLAPSGRYATSGERCTEYSHAPRCAAHSPTAVPGV